MGGAARTRRDAVLARAHDHTADHQTATRAEAGNSGARWTAEDDAALLVHWHEPAHDVARMRGRSLYAVRGRKGEHRRRGTAP